VSGLPGIAMAVVALNTSSFFGASAVKAGAAMTKMATAPIAIPVIFLFLVRSERGDLLVLMILPPKLFQPHSQNCPSPFPLCDARSPRRRFRQIGGLRGIPF
jgi:hypothetical protein